MCFQILFNISKPIMVVRKVRDIFVVGHLRNINLLHILKIHLGLVTIFYAKLWLKQEIYGKMSLFALFSSFNLIVLLTIFTFTLDKLHCCWWKCFHLYLTITASVFTFTVLPWLVCNFVLTFTLTFTRYTLTLMLFDCSVFTVTLNY